MREHSSHVRVRALLSRLYEFFFGGWKRRVFLALVLVAVVAAISHRSWVGAQARAVVVLSTAIRTPVVSWAVERLTDRPLAEETLVADLPTTVVRPGGGDGPWPVVVFVNGATARGRHHPDVQALARGLARAGYLVLIPELPGLRDGEITDRTLAATVAVALAGADRHEARNSQVGLVGVSVGGTLALLAAQDPALAERVSAVAGIAPYASLAEVIRLATTGTYRDGDRLLRYPADPFVGVVVARSLAAGLPLGPDREALAAEARAIERDSDQPLAGLRARQTTDLGPTGRAIVELLGNQDPVRFDELYASLPAEIQAGIERLSPLRGAAGLEVPVELVSAPQDRYFPPAQSRALERVLPSAKLTLTGTFGHAIPRPSLSDPAGLLRFDAWAVRALRSLRSRHRRRTATRRQPRQRTVS